MRTEFWWRNLGKSPFERQIMSCEDDIKIYLSQIDCKDGRWMELAQNRVQ
jgi:hypothetical protein